jgi:hypothetical protein
MLLSSDIAERMAEKGMGDPEERRARDRKGDAVMEPYSQTSSGFSPSHLRIYLFVVANLMILLLSFGIKNIRSDHTAVKPQGQTLKEPKGSDEADRQQTITGSLRTNT